MYNIIGIALSLTAVISGWNYHPAIVLIGGLYLGHLLTEVLNNPAE
jgi:hypothetical protein